MSIGRPQGVAVLIFGLILFTYGVLVLIFVTGWGRWIADYPQVLANLSVPPEAAPVVKGMRGVFGPLLVQVGGYMEIMGYCAGALMTLISLGPIGVGAKLVIGNRS